MGSPVAAASLRASIVGGVEAGGGCAPPPLPVAAAPASGAGGGGVHSVKWQMSSSRAFCRRVCMAGRSPSCAAIECPRPPPWWPPDAPPAPPPPADASAPSRSDQCSPNASSLQPVWGGEASAWSEERGA